MNTDKIYAESIANEYSVKNDSKVIALKKLDKKVKDFPLAIAIALGVVSILVLGIGLCFAMGVIGSGAEISFVAGIIFGLIGMIGMAVNYPIYQRLIASRKSKYAGDIIRLATEISNEC